MGFEFDLDTNESLSMHRKSVKLQDIKQASVVVVESEDQLFERMLVIVFQDIFR